MVSYEIGNRNLPAKKKMSDALDVLLKMTSISKVKISDIVKISGVSRQTFTQSNFQLSKKRIKMVSGCEPTSEEEFLLELYWSGAGQMLADWIINGMKEEPRVLAQMFYDGLPLPLRKYWVK